MVGSRSPVRNWDDLIALWASPAEFGEDAGLKLNHVHTLKARKNIPSEHWPSIIAGAKRRHIRGVTAELLLGIQQNVARETAA